MQPVGEPPIVILGAGLTGLSAAWHLDKPCVIVERESRVGGKAATDRRDGFTFDITGHWLHLREDRSRALLNQVMPAGDLVQIERRTSVFSHNTMLPYPFQANLYGLPLPIVHECLTGLFEAHCSGSPAGAETTLQAFAESRFGKGIAKHFFVPYNTKLWGVRPDELGSAWVTRYIPVPQPAQILAGAIGLRQQGLGYNAQFLYPKTGGIDGIPLAFAQGLSVRPSVEMCLGAGVEHIDLTHKRVVLAGVPEPIAYNRMISTIPLPDLIDRMDPVPVPVLAARRSLRSVSWRYLNLAVRTPCPIDDHWVYVPEPHLPFFRVGVFSNALRAMAPSGCSSLYVELTDRQAPPDLPGIFGALAAMGAIRDPADVLFAEVRDVPHAYVVFDEAHGPATAAIHGWLADHDVLSCGRYGAWVYSSMEDAMLDGIEAARWAQP